MSAGFTLTSGHLSGKFATLPVSARKHFVRLKEKKDDAHAALMAMTEKSRRAHEEKQRLTIRLDQLQNPGKHHLSFLPLAADDPQCLEIEKEIKTISEDVDRLILAVEERQKVWNALGGLVENNVGRWIENIYEAGAYADMDVQPSIRKQESIVEAIERRRRRLRELSADLNSIHSAPRPAAVAKDQARKEIEALADRGRPNCFGLLERGESIHFPTKELAGTVSSKRDFVSLRQVDAIAVVAWLHRDALIAKIEKDIDALSDDANALTDEQRTEREQTALNDLLANEREEEVLIRIAEEQNNLIPRRPDANPLAVLGLAAVSP